MAILKIFTMNGCAHCTALKEKLVEESIEFDEYNIDSSEGRRLVEKFNLRAYPTVLIVKDNKIVHAQEGFNMQENTRAWLDTFQ